MCCLCVRYSLSSISLPLLPLLTHTRFLLLNQKSHGHLSSRLLFHHLRPCHPVDISVNTSSTSIDAATLIILSGWKSTYLVHALENPQATLSTLLFMPRSILFCYFYFDCHRLHHHLYLQRQRQRHFRLHNYTKVVPSRVSQA